jgi:hypothetical protein
MLKLKETRVIRKQLVVRADVRDLKLLKTNVVWACPGGHAIYYVRLQLFKCWDRGLESR